MQNFVETGLRPELLDSLETIGFKTPTPIQSKTIPYILESDNDLVAMAQTGTGKTAAFGLPILQKINTEVNKIQSIILCPTRELCLQITRDIERFSAHLPLSVVAVYGGEPINRQINALKRKCHMIVGTPGRVNDLINRKILNLGSIRFLVLDEADEMLKMGFKDEMDAILAETPKTKQTLLFSATIPPDIESIAGKYMNTPHKISVTHNNQTAENINHFYMVTSPSTAYPALRRFADMHPNIYSIVFCRTRQETKDIANKLIEDGYNADALHGELSQGLRDQVMGRFRKKHLQILVATDVAARGLDVNNLTHVIHYHLPDETENYVHRSGRTGRAGKSGVSVAIISPKETNKIKILERKIKKSFTRIMIPGGMEVFQNRLINYLETLKTVEPNSFPLDKYWDLVQEHLNHLSKEDLIKAILSREFHHVYEDYSAAPDLNVSPERSNSSKNKRTRREKGRRFSKFSINLGRKNNMRPDLLINLINRHTPEYNIQIGKIDIQPAHTIFEADQHYEKELIKAFRKAKFKGNTLNVQTFKKHRR